MKTDVAIDFGAATLLDGDMPDRMKLVETDHCPEDQISRGLAGDRDFDTAEHRIFEPLERAWGLGGATHVFARKDSCLPEAIDRVFGAMAVPELDRRA